MEDYAGAWSAERGRCHRFVYDPNGKPDNCPEPPVAVGWRYAAHTRSWHAVDACTKHASQLQDGPDPPTGRSRTRDNRVIGPTEDRRALGSGDPARHNGGAIN
jgi:hypothetical protein